MFKSNPSVLVWPLYLLLLGLTAWLTWGSAVPAVVLQRPDGRAHVQGDDYPKLLVDAYGQRIVLHQPPRRIVSAMLATDEILLDLIPKERIAAVSPFAAIPGLSNCATQAANLPRIGGLTVEPVVALQPDLVLTSRLADGNVVAQLRQCGVPIFCFGQFDSLEEIRDNVLLLGQAVGEVKRAKKITGWMDGVLAEVRRRTRHVAHQPRVLYYSDGFTAGRRTIFDELVQLAGGINLAAEAGLSGHTILSTEMVLALDPEVLILPRPFFASSGTAGAARPAVLDDPAWQAIKAVRNGQVYVLPTEHLNCVSHHVVKAAVDVGHALHPDRIPAELDLGGAAGGLVTPPSRPQREH